MITHVGLLTLSGPAAAASVKEGLEALIGVVPGLERVRVGLDAGLKEGNGSLVFALEFTTEQDWRGYGAHPAHVAVIQDRIAPHLVSKAFVQLNDGTFA